MSDSQFLPSGEQPNIKADFYAGPLDGMALYFSGAYATYFALVPIRGADGEVLHRERAFYQLDTTRRHFPLLYKYVGSQKEESQG